MTSCRLWHRRNLYGPELRMETRIQPNKTGISDHSTKCGRKRKQTGNHLILYRSRFTRQQQETQGTIPYYWIGKPKSHFGITLVVKA
jgi:hypothetical protein